MHITRSLVLVGALLAAGAAQAQTANDCPQLPAGTATQWEVQQGPSFVFCRAVERDTARQAFAVTIGREATFKPRRTDRVGNRVSIDGNQTYWHAPQNDLSTGTLVRETLLELPSGDYAHIIVRANDETQLTRALQEVEGLHFSGIRLGSK
ncbi:hypothetical protein CMZ82_02185 [Lysobacteraceae bacterium NML93-0792]|nr:hypothetical protein CMZ82_02185 [Xanthomonadaceae bacterium NML93-0792]PBS16414.1 hypothetical protein CMZ81_06435 [Xanthomonadaceae bacterium NML93-0793]PBS19223.1 hypothetical protein CMZ80_08580 [Xanthomonadaceae bacterium NML93-0831]